MALRSVAKRQRLILGQIRQAACAARTYATGEQQVMICAVLLVHAQPSNSSAATQAASDVCSQIHTQQHPASSGHASGVLCHASSRVVRHATLTRAVATAVPAGRCYCWRRPRRLCCRHQGRAVGHEGHVCGGAGLTGWHLPQRGLHPIKGTDCCCPSCVAPACVDFDLYVLLLDLRCCRWLVVQWLQNCSAAEAWGEPLPP